MKNLFMCSIVALCTAVDVYAGAELTASAEIWSSLNYTTYVGGIRHGTHSAGIEASRDDYVNSKAYIFFGDAHATSDYTSISTRLYMANVSNTCPRQFIRAVGNSRNTYAVSGIQGTGSVQYWVDFLSISESDGERYPCTWSTDFYLKHNGANVPLNRTYTDGGYSFYSSGVHSIVFGKPFSVEAGLSSLAFCLEERSVSNLSLRWQMQDLHISFSVRDAAGNWLTNSPSSYTITSESGSPYANSPRLFFKEKSPPSMQVSWHSITDKVYQLQYTTNPASGAWRNIGGQSIGVGTTNFLNASMTGDLHRLYRVIQP